MNDLHSPATPAGVMAIGLLALGQHIHEHGLPGFIAIQAPSATDPRLTIDVHPDDLHAWSRTAIDVTSADVDPVRSMPTYETASFEGLLADTGTRVRIRTVRLVAASVQLVSA